MTKTKTVAKNTKGAYHCTQCSAKAYSKCIGQRSIFLGSNGGDQDHLEGMLGACITYKDEPYRDFEGKVHEDSEERVHRITITLHGHDDDLTGLLFGRFIASLKQLSTDALERTLCQHDWEIDSDAQCMFGCCRGKDVPKEEWIES